MFKDTPELFFELSNYGNGAAETDVEYKLSTARFDK